VLILNNLWWNSNNSRNFTTPRQQKGATPPAEMAPFMVALETKKRQASRRVEHVLHYYLVAIITKEQ
jgi:hypothetical protein